MGLVSIVECVNYAEVVNALNMGIHLIGDVQFPDDPILIKPNLCIENDVSGGANSDIRVVRAVVDFILKRSRSAEVRIIESDSVGKWADVAFFSMGYTQLEEKYLSEGFDVSTVNLSKEKVKRVKLEGLFFSEILLPEILLQPHFFISVSKAKTHGITTISSTLKNQFGCLPEKDMNKYHRHMDKVIVDINRLMNPDLCVVDAIIGLEGVTKGNTKNLGVLLCGKNVVAVDTVLAKIMGFDPKKIRHIVLAEENSLGETDFQIVGKQINEVMKKFKPRDVWWRGGFWKYVPNFLYDRIRRIYEKNDSAQS